MSDRKLQIFISSTFLDLKDERQAAVTAILENGHIPAGMELFAAGNEEQMQVIRRWIDESDIFLLILGKRYGSIEPKSQKSYVHLEYDYAIETSKPYFSLVLSDAFMTQKVRSGQTVDEVYEQREQGKFQDFEKLVRSKMCSFPDDDKDIRLAIASSVRTLEKSHKFSGWVSGRTVDSEARVKADLSTALQLASAIEEKRKAVALQIERIAKNSPKFEDNPSKE